MNAVTLSAPYHKRVLMPFIERVPLSDQFPALSQLALNFNLNSDILPGAQPQTFELTDRQGQPHRIAAAICYEQFYPAQLAELVRGGAELLALLTNVGWFSQTQGQHQIAAFTQMRAIELRRSIAYAANTGQTCLIDPFGRVTSAVPWWSEQTLRGQAQLSRALSFYVRQPDLFAKACVWLAAVLLASAGAVGARLVAGLRQPGRAAHSPFELQQEEI